MDSCSAVLVDAEQRVRGSRLSPNEGNETRLPSVTTSRFINKERV